METASNFRKHQIVIIGGGSAGITTAAQLLRKNSELDIAIIEPAEWHYYQPAWTLVGGGTYENEATRKPMREFIPKKATWLKEYVTDLQPEQNLVLTREGDPVQYEYLIVAAGIQLDWDKMPGLKEGVTTNGICSNYSYQTAPYTYETLQNFKGGNAIFTQPATPIKCGGAPLKIMFLAEEYFRKHGLRDKTNVAFFTPGTVIFGVEPFKQTLQEIVKERNIATNFYIKPVEIRPDKKEIVFEQREEAPAKLELNEELNKLQAYFEGQRLVVPFDMLHLPPPQSAPDFIKRSNLAKSDDPLGFIDVDHHSLQHNQYPNVFALGDVAALPTAKTGAAVRKQVPVVVDNLMALLQHEEIGQEDQYGGYSSCPLVTGYGKVVMAEFGYGNEPQPTFPIDQSKERKSMWYIKKYFLPWMYWNMMLRGREL